MRGEAGRLAIEAAKEERHVGEERDEEEWYQEPDAIERQTPRPAVGVEPVAQHDDERDEEGHRRHVPGVEERQPAHDQPEADEPERPFQPDNEVERLIRAQERQGDANGEEYEWNRHNVRMEVAQEEAKERYLMDPGARI